ncbi:MAG: hypothetical protein H7Z42_20355 [Roseiflexaceae bacterium]|nr:hypothetical protein [Roseiflexaceae bacterium]
MNRIARMASAVAAVAAVVLASVSPVAAQAPTSFTLQPGGKAVVTFEAFCTEFGQVFPSAVQLPDGVVAEPARSALAYGVGKNYNGDAAQALQLQYAIWQTLGTTNSPKGDATAQDVLTNGKTAPVAPQGTSVVDAAAANQVTLTLDSWQPIGPKVQITPTASDNFYGRGQITIENTSQQAVTLFMPVGTRFPATNAAQQTMAGYATNAQVTNPQAAADPAPAQLPSTSGGALNALLPLLALGLLALGGTLHLARRVNSR